MSWFFTADLHFDHPWMAQHRGFPYVTKMDNHLIECWNDTIKGGDVVVVCGDVFWESHNMKYNMKIWDKLNGNKIFVKGNHDRRWIKKSDWDDVTKNRKIYHKLVKKGMNSQYIVACHYPIEGWDRKRYGAIHVHGHSHGKTMPIEGRLDVGVDVAKTMLGEYRPFSFDEVIYLTKGIVDNECNPN